MSDSIDHWNIDLSKEINSFEIKGHILSLRRSVESVRDFSSDDDIMVDRVCFRMSVDDKPFIRQWWISGMTL